jgi:5-methylcytosine-specific restriction endonuclease McrA
MSAFGYAAPRDREALERLASRGILDHRGCTHERTAIRYSLNSLGRKIFKRQCLSCGEATSCPLKYQEVERAAGLMERVEEWDAALASKREEFFRLLTEERDRINSEKSSEWWLWYNQYLQSPEWRQKRALVFRRADDTCEGCGRAPATQVHHLTYANVGAEFLWQLAAICDDCHQRVHPNGEPRQSFGWDEIL